MVGSENMNGGSWGSDKIELVSDYYEKSVIMLLIGIYFRCYVGVYYLYSSNNYVSEFLSSELYITLSASELLKVIYIFSRKYILIGS